MKYDLSILIPARNEVWLSRTVDDILAKKRGKTEVIVVLDGDIKGPGMSVHPDLTVVVLPKSIGQRAATNKACRLSSAKYIIKCDAHCIFDEGFDVKMMQEMHDDWTMVPTMRHVHAFDWVCPDGHRRFQSPSGLCLECGKPTEMDVVWKMNEKSPHNIAYCFDKTLHFRYHSQQKEKTKHELISETMSLQGSFFMITRKKYWELNICDEAFGSWGQQGVEVACKTWLSGGKVMVNKKTWYAHLFRTQGGDFGFPYPQDEAQVEHAREYSRELFLEGIWPLAIRPLSWMLERFNPVGWDEVTKQIAYYTCNTHEPAIDNMCRTNLAQMDLQIVSVSLNKEIDFGHERAVIKGKKGPLMMHKQVLMALEQCTSDVVFLCESDVMYHPSHFDFIPPREDTIYYNTNVWRMRWPDGHAVWTDNLQQVSGICAYRKTLIDFYEKRIAQIEKDGFNRHYEPGIKQTVGTQKVENRMSRFPNVDIRHDNNITGSKWKPEDFRNKGYAAGWKETDDIPGWGSFSDILK